MGCLITRRSFIGRAACGALVLPPARPALAYGTNERLRLAVVGMAGYGAYHGFAESIHLYKDVVYAVSCDVDTRKAAKVYDMWGKRAAEWANSPSPDQRRAAADHYVPLAEKKPPLYADFRRMFEEAADSFDAVVVATPDHTHALISAAALRAGKPVLAEKPLTISAHEARILTGLARRKKLPTQMNNGGTASNGFRRGVEIVREGILGEVGHVHVFFSRGGRNYQAPPQGSQKVPKELNWDLWLAQVRWREYHPEWINRVGWRDTSIGELGNFGPHAANMAFMALNVGELWAGSAGDGRIKVVSECSEANQLSYPRWEKIRWEIPGRLGLPPVTFTWYHGPPPDYAPGSRAALEEKLRGHGAGDKDVKDILSYAGCIIEGSKGLLATNSHNTEVRLLPEHKFRDVERGKPLSLPSSPGHYKEWIEACRGGKAFLSNFEYAGPFAEFLCLGSISTRFPGEGIEFDPATGRITNHPRAAGFLGYEYRKGWTL